MTDIYLLTSFWEEEVLMFIQNIDDNYYSELPNCVSDRNELSHNINIIIYSFKCYTI